MIIKLFSNSKSMDARDLWVLGRQGITNRHDSTLEIIMGSETLPGIIIIICAHRSLCHLQTQVKQPLS